MEIGRQGEGLEIEIEDTGSGMAEAKLTELQNNMCNADIEMLKGGGRVGIINACVRLENGNGKQSGIPCRRRRRSGNHGYDTDSLFAGG